MSWNFGSDLITLVNSLEIIFGSCELFRCSQLHTEVFHHCDFHVVAMCLSRAQTVTGKQSVPRCVA